MQAPTANRQLINWVSHWEEILTPDRVHWCDGSTAEYDSLADALVDRMLEEPELVLIVIDRKSVV